MKYQRFEEIPVWNDGVDLTTRVFSLTEDNSFRQKGDIANQVQRAALSVPNNIAEGFERGTTQELITFLYIARGSAGEVRSILCVIERMKYFDHLKSQISDLKSLAESISRQLRAWADSLQNTDIRGQRYLNEETKKGFKQKQAAEDVMSEIRKINEESARKRSDITNLIKSEIKKKEDA
jgi:four helix bundle protein